MLKTHGVKKGDRVAIYMSMCPLAVAAIAHWSCAQVGSLSVCMLGQQIILPPPPSSPPLPHLFAVSVVFTGFSADALRGRIEDCRAETVLTIDQGVRGGKTLELKRTVDEAA